MYCIWHTVTRTERWLDNRVPNSFDRYVCLGSTVRNSWELFCFSGVLFSCISRTHLAKKLCVHFIFCVCKTHTYALMETLDCNMFSTNNAWNLMNEIDSHLFRHILCVKKKMSDNGLHNSVEPCDFSFTQIHSYVN